MLVEKNDNPQLESKPLFPRLMKSKQGSVILFINYGSGTVLYASKEGPNSFGEFSNSWNMSLFSDYHGVITLSND